MKQVAGLQAVNAEGLVIGTLSVDDLTELVSAKIIQEAKDKAVSARSVSIMSEASTLAATDEYEDKLDIDTNPAYIRSLDSEGNPKRTATTSLATVVGGLLPFADTNQSGILPAQYRLSNKSKLTSTNYIILKGNNYIVGHVVLLSIERPDNTTFAIINVSTNSSSSAYSKLTVRKSGNIIASARLVRKNDGSNNAYIEIRTSIATNVGNINAICLTGSIIEVTKSESPVDNVLQEVQCDLGNL